MSSEGAHPKIIWYVALIEYAIAGKCLHQSIRLITFASEMTANSKIIELSYLTSTLYPMKSVCSQFKKALYRKLHGAVC